MRIATLGRFLGALCLAGSLTYAASGPASATPPAGWYMHVENMPSTAAHGDGVAYRVIIGNAGPSNISTLYLLTDTQASPTFRIVDPSQATCSDPGSGPLQCTLAALPAGAEVTLFVGYDAPTSGSSFDPGFQANSSGFTLSDGPGRHSHGDTLTDDTETGTTLSSSGDFAGGFSLGHRAVSTNSNLNNKNVQSTTVNPPADFLVTTVDDGSTSGFDCPAGHSCFGTWSQLKVRSLSNFDAKTETFPQFEVTLTVRGSNVPGDISSLELVHVTDDGVAHIIDQSTPCGDAPSVGCLDVAKVGGNYQFTTWVDQNGGIRGIR